MQYIQYVGNRYIKNVSFCSSKKIKIPISKHALDPGLGFLMNMVPDLDINSKCESGSHAATRSSNKKKSERGSGFTEQDSMQIQMNIKRPDSRNDKLKGGQQNAVL